MDRIADAVEAVLTDTHRLKVIQRWDVPMSREIPTDLLTRIADVVDLALLGLGNCGACMTWECGLSAQLRESVPTLDIVTEPFAALARAAFRAQGLPQQPVVVLPRGAETANAADLDRYARLIADACTAELTTAAI
jgi:hypothetical protein